MWRTEGIAGIVDFQVKSQHAFRSERRAAAIRRHGELIMKLQHDKIELNWKLAVAEENCAHGKTGGSMGKALVLACVIECWTS